MRGIAKKQSMVYFIRLFGIKRWIFLWKIFSVYEMTYQWIVLYMKCPVLSMNCPVLSMKCSVLSMKCSVLSMKCPVLSMKCPVYEILLLWNDPTLWTNLNHCMVLLRGGKDSCNHIASIPQLLTNIDLRQRAQL